jgi:hypothetical protein
MPNTPSQKRALLQSEWLPAPAYFASVKTVPLLIQ